MLHLWGSDDDDPPECDGTNSDGSPLLVPSEYLVPGSLEIALQNVQITSPAERDTLLLMDPDLDNEDMEEPMEGNSNE